MRAAPCLAVAAYMVRCNARLRLTRTGVLALVALGSAGRILAWTRDRGPAFDPELFFLGFLVGAIFVLRSGLEEQRIGDADTFLRMNLVTPRTHATAVILSLVATWAVFCVLALLVALVASGGAVEARWAAASLAARSALLLPAVPFVEAGSRLRTPFIVPVLVFLALMLGLALSLGEDAAVRLLAGAGRPGEPSSLLPLVARAGATSSVGFGAFLLRAGRLPGLSTGRPGRPWACPDGADMVPPQRRSGPPRQGGDP